MALIGDRRVLAVAALAVIAAGDALATGTSEASQTFLWLAIIIFLA